jgi:hypothetical protein
MRLPRTVTPDAARARTYARRARFLGPLPQAGLVAVLFVAVALAWLDRGAVVTYLGLMVLAVAVGLFLGGMFGPITGRRRWLLRVAEDAAAYYGKFRIAVDFRRPLEHPYRARVVDPDVDEAIDTTLRLEGAAPFLLRRGERAWLRATTVLLIQTDRGDAP